MSVSNAAELHRGQLLYAVEHGTVEGGVVAIERTNRVYSKREQMVGPKAQIGMREVQEGAGQQTGSDQKDHRYREFGHQQDFPQPGRARPAAVRHVAGLEGLVNPGGRGGQSRREAE